MATWDWSYNGVPFGGTSGLDVSTVDGWLDLPDVRTGDTPRSRAHGLYAGLDLAGGRTVRFGGEIHAADQTAAAALLAPLRNATVIQSAEGLLLGTTPGYPTLRLSCRPRRRVQPIRWDSTIGAATFDLEFFAPDPRLYADTASTATVSANPTVTGLTFSATAPFVFGSSTTGNVMNLQNDGNFPCQTWVAQISGGVTPLVLPELVHINSGKRLTFSGATLNLGDVLTVTPKTIYLSSTASRYSWLSPTSQWFDLDPNSSNPVQFLAASGTGSVTVTWRSCWL